jgi:hypothetical protein
MLKVTKQVVEDATLCLQISMAEDAKPSLVPSSTPKRRAYGTVMRWRSRCLPAA